VIIDGVPITRELLANAAAVVSILSVLFASPLLLGAHVVVQRSSLVTQLIWFGAVLSLLVGALAAWHHRFDFARLKVIRDTG
jgi:hypothetical protein